MVFSLRGPVDRGANPFTNIVSDAMKTRQEWEKAKYAGQQQQADIFSKKIGPMAQIAISPMFSLLPKEQQEQFAHIMQRSMTEQEPHSKARDLLSGLSNRVSQMFGGKNNEEPNDQAKSGYSNNQTQEIGHGGVLPGNPGEHQTAKFGETGHTANKVFYDKEGNPIVTPDAATVKRAQELTLISKNIDKDFNKYINIAPKFAQSGALSHKVSEYTGELEKSKIPFISSVGKALGGGKVAEQGAEVRGLRTKLAPIMQATGFTPEEIADNLDYHNGESGEHYKKRLQELFPFVKARIRSQLEASISGTNVGGQQQQAPEQQAVPEQETYNPEQPTQAKVYVELPNGKKGFISAEAVEAFKRDHPGARIGE